MRLHHVAYFFGMVAGSILATFAPWSGPWWVTNIVIAIIVGTVMMICENFFKMR